MNAYIQKLLFFCIYARTVASLGLRMGGGKEVRECIYVETNLILYICSVLHLYLREKVGARKGAPLMVGSAGIFDDVGQ